MLDINALTTTSANPTFISICYALALSFILGTIIAVVYVRTFQGLSYSRNFLHCLVLCPVVTAIAMQAVGDNLARGIGMVGAISLLRFRSSLKDPRDMFFLFASLAMGVACGVHSYSIGVVGCFGFVASAFVISATPFGQSNQYDGLLRFNMAMNFKTNEQLEKLMTENCKAFALITLREIAQGNRLDYSYQVKLRKNRSYENFINDLQTIAGMKGVNLMLQDTTFEV